MRTGIKRVVGVDFTSAPTRDKAIVVADCALGADALTLKAFHAFSDWPAYERWLRGEDDWIGGFDFPFGLPRRFVAAQGWDRSWPAMVESCARLGKEEFSKIAMHAFQSARTPEDKHRETDLRARSESPLKTLANPPVGKMFYEGAWRLLCAGIRLPRLHETSSRKIAVEAYPGLAVARMGERYYKNDKPHSKAANSAARGRILANLKADKDRLFGFRLRVGSKELEAEMDDADGDWLDAALCAMQAAWAWRQGSPGFGLPRDVEPCEGWIAGA